MTSTSNNKYHVTLFVRYPAWDEVNGIDFGLIEAASKSEAIKQAKRKCEHDKQSGGKRWVAEKEVA